MKVSQWALVIGIIYAIVTDPLHLRAEENSNLKKYEWTTHARATFADAFDEEGLWIAGVGSSLTLLALSQDSTVHDHWKDHQQMSSSVSHWGDVWGSGVPEALILAGQIYFDPDSGIPGMEGLIAGGVVTDLAKVLVGRKRPDSDVRTSMPSGHSQASFSLASSMTMSYGWKKALPFWGMGVLTGLSRLADNKHWLSDVIAGATVGTLFGRAGYKHHQHTSAQVAKNFSLLEVRPTVLFDAQDRVDGLFLNLGFYFGAD